MGSLLNARSAIVVTIAAALVLLGRTIARWNDRRVS